MSMFRSNQILAVSMDYLRSKGIHSIQSLLLMNPLLNPNVHPSPMDTLLKDLPVDQRRAIYYMVTHSTPDYPIDSIQIGQQPFVQAVPTKMDARLAKHLQVKSENLESAALNTEELLKRMTFYGAITDDDLKEIRHQLTGDVSMKDIIGFLPSKTNISYYLFLASLRDSGFNEMAEEGTNKNSITG